MHLYTRALQMALSISALLALTVLSFAAPAQAQMIVAGPVTTTTLNLEEWYSRQLPPVFQARDILAVDPLADGPMDAYLKGNGVDPGPDTSAHAGQGGEGQVDGIFVDHPARITLRVSQSGSLDLLTAAHEYGHYVWFNLLSKEDRRAYKDIYERQRRAGHLISDYATTNLEEGFAEAFSFYVNQPVALTQSDPESSQFLQAWADAHSRSAQVQPELK